MKSFLLCMVSLACLAGLTSCGDWNVNNCNSHASKIVELETDMLEGMIFNAHTSHSYINVTGIQENKCYVKANVNVCAQSVEEANEIIRLVNVRLDKSGNQLTAVVDKPQLTCNCGGIFVDYDVKLPRKSNVVLKTTHDPVNCDNLEGNVAASTSHGTIVCRDIVGNLKLNTSHDPIEISNIEGNVDAQTSHGRIRINNVKGDINAHTSHDPIEAEYVTGNLKLRTSHGSVICRNIDTSLLDVWTSHNNVSISFVNDFKNELASSIETSHGNISFDLPESFNGSIDMSTTHGIVRSDVPLTVRGTISEEMISGTVGNGSGKVKLKTTHGSIDLK